MEHLIDVQEQTYQDKLDKLRQKEEEITNLLKRKERDLSKEDYEQRQRMLKEIESYRSKETDLTRQRELLMKELRVEQDRIRDKEEQLNSKLNEIEKTQYIWSREREELIRSKNEMALLLDKRITKSNETTMYAKQNEITEMENIFRLEKEQIEMYWKNEMDLMIQSKNSEIQQLDNEWKRDRETLLLSTVQEIELLKKRHEKEIKDLQDKLVKHQKETDAEKEMLYTKYKLLNNKEDYTSLGSQLKEAITDAMKAQKTNTSVSYIQHNKSIINDDDDEVSELLQELKSDYDMQLQLETTKWRIREQELKNENKRLEDHIQQMEAENESLKLNSTRDRTRLLELDRQLNEIKVSSFIQHQKMGIQNMSMNGVSMLSTIPNNISSMYSTIPPSTAPVHKQDVPVSSNPSRAQHEVKQAWDTIANLEQEEMLNINNINSKNTNYGQPYVSDRNIKNDNVPITENVKTVNDIREEINKETTTVSMTPRTPRSGTTPRGILTRTNSATQPLVYEELKPPTTEKREPRSSDYPPLLSNKREEFSNPLELVTKVAFEEKKTIPLVKNDPEPPKQEPIKTEIYKPEPPKPEPPKPEIPKPEPVKTETPEQKAERERQERIMAEIAERRRKQKEELEKQKKVKEKSHTNN